MGCGASKEAPSSKNEPAKQEVISKDKDVVKGEPEPKKEESADSSKVESSVEVESEKPKASNESSVNSNADESRKELVMIVKEDANSSPKTQGFDHQMGGHEGTFHKVDETKIMKKAGKAETEFYEIIHLYPSLQTLAPKFHGINEVDGTKYIIIEDLTHNFKKPCILDVKIGKQSFGEDASPEKREGMEKKDKESTTFSLGMRITAMKVYQSTNGDYIKTGKKEGQKVTEETFSEALSQYFKNGKSFRKNLIPHFLERLAKVQQWAENQGELRLYSSSVLLIYDGEEDENEVPRVEIRIIDFAHAFKIEDGGKDHGYIFGINNLVKVLKEMAESN